MASIAYVTDQKMIEFHRLNGNHSINFWKPSSAKKMSSFNSSDLLFFLAKGSEKGRGKEKGLIGYGKFQKSYMMTFSQMWTKYGTLNGYPTKEALREAITKVTKNHKMPEYLNCLLLEDVVFFQYPVYLSEIGMEISNKIESYIYIDKEDMLNTSKILNLADDMGVDMWSSLFYDNELTTFLKDAQIQTIQNIYERISTSYYRSYDQNRIYHAIQQYRKHFPQTQMVHNAKTEFMVFDENRIQLYLPCIVNANDFEKKLQYVIGHYMMYQGYLAQSPYADDIQVVIVFNQAISKEICEVLKIQKINYEIRLVDID